MNRVKVEEMQKKEQTRGATVERHWRDGDEGKNRDEMRNGR